jgi:predicted amidohydrolase
MTDRISYQTGDNLHALENSKQKVECASCGNYYDISQGSKTHYNHCNDCGGSKSYDEQEVILDAGAHGLRIMTVDEMLDQGTELLLDEFELDSVLENRLDYTLDDDILDSDDPSVGVFYVGIPSRPNGSDFVDYDPIEVSMDDVFRALEGD